MSLYHDLVGSVEDGEVIDVRVGVRWTAVVVRSAGQERCGLASTLHPREHMSEATVPLAGRLSSLGARELAGYCADDRNPTHASIGMAALNALIPPPAETIEVNAGDVLAKLGAGKSVALIGHFPFVPELKDQVGALFTFDENPRETGDLPISAQPEIIPQVDVLALTAMTLVNHSFESLMGMRKPGAPVLVLGPSTPMTQAMYAWGADLLSGSIVTNIPGVLRMVSQAAGFRQIKEAGVSLVTITRPGFTW